MSKRRWLKAMIVMLAIHIIILLPTRLIAKPPFLHEIVELPIQNQKMMIQIDPWGEFSPLDFTMTVKPSGGNVGYINPQPVNAETDCAKWIFDWNIVLLLLEILLGI